MARVLKNRLRVVVLVSTDCSDLYFANTLIKNLEVVGVFVERQDTGRANGPGLLSKALRYSSRPGLVIKKISDAYYHRRYGSRALKIAVEGFGREGLEISPHEGLKVVYTEKANDINNPVYAEEIKRLRPDVIAVCGTSILKRPILTIPAKGVLNLHGGLSEEYRGVWTTLWAVYNGEPWKIGATVHYVSEGIDDGNIIYQGRPEISADDNHETLYVKVVKLGTALMIRAISDIQDGSVKSFPLLKKGKLYLRKDVTPRVVAEVWKKIDRGFIRDYAQGSQSRVADKRLTEHGSSGDI